MKQLGLSLGRLDNLTGRIKVKKKVSTMTVDDCNSAHSNTTKRE
jgi:hypothetical protein